MSPVEEKMEISKAANSVLGLLLGGDAKRRTNQGRG
jgi:hypothetical protein